MQNTYNHINNTKIAREVRGWSQGDVAEKLGCDARSVGR
jgi:ribosome-binding protein aMBF1 (putative translation factor)